MTINLMIKNLFPYPFSECQMQNKPPASAEFTRLLSEADKKRNDIIS